MKQNTDYKTQYELIKKLEFSFEQFMLLKEYAEELEIEFLSTAFDLPSLNFLNEIGVKRFKIPSGEINNLPYLRQICKFKKPIILSTGMADMSEIHSAINIFLSRIQKI